MSARQLRHILRDIVLATLPAAAVAGCGDARDGDPRRPLDCDETASADIRINPPVDAQLQFLIDQCNADRDTCYSLCAEALRRAGIDYYPYACEAEPDRDGRMLLHVEYGGGGCDVGRRPGGLSPHSLVSASSAAGEWLARAAWLEAASVFAFLRLAEELGQHDAPAPLQALARRCAIDEVQHATMVNALARAYGASATRVEIAPSIARPLTEIARENAVEGCVRETWGALIADCQARTALDPIVRQVFVLIARDEARHAALAWSVDAWARTRLDADAVDAIDAARHRAVESLLAETHVGNTALGLPSAALAGALVQTARRAIWNCAAGRA